MLETVGSIDLKLWGKHDPNDETVRYGSQEDKVCLTAVVVQLFFCTSCQYLERLFNPCHDRLQCNASIPFETYALREDTMKELFTVHQSQINAELYFPILPFDLHITPAFLNPGSQLCDPRPSWRQSNRELSFPKQLILLIQTLKFVLTSL